MDVNKMARRMFICVVFSVLLPICSPRMPEDGRGYQSDEEKRLTREYHLRQGALRGLVVKPSRQYDLQMVEMFLGIPYAAPPVGTLRFMPPVNAPPWSGVRMATHFAPVCPQALPPVKKSDPPSLGRQHYMARLKPFLTHESEDCLYLNIYVPYREQKSKKFPVLVFIHGDSYEWSSGNPYDGRTLASYGNIMVITVNFRLGILGFMKPSLTEHDYGNNGLLDQLAALQWIKDNIEDLNGDPKAVTLMGHGTGAACVNFLMLSPISNGLFHRAILMSGSALSDWAMTKNPSQYTLQVAQSLGCNPSSKDMMTCLQNKPLADIKKVQILAREFETPLGPVVAGSFIPNEPAKTMEAFPNLLSKYQLLSGVTELESYHDFGAIELDHGILEDQRDEFIKQYEKVVFEGADDVILKEVLKRYSPSKLDPQRWTVEMNSDVILNIFSDARTLAPMVRFAKYQSNANRQSYFYVFGHNSVSTDYAPLNKSVNGEELPYVLGVPLGGNYTHFHSHYTLKEQLLSEVMMRLWTNFVKIGTPNTHSRNEYYTLDRKQWAAYNVDWPEYNDQHKTYLRFDLPPYISSDYRSNETKFWNEELPHKMRKFIVDPLYEYTQRTTKLKSQTQKPVKVVVPHKNPVPDPIRKIWSPTIIESPHYSPPAYGREHPYATAERKPDTDNIYREIQSIKTPSRLLPTGLMERANVHSTSTAPSKITPNMPVKTSGATITLIISLGILFLAVNVAICAILYFKKRKLQLRERAFESTRNSGAEIGEVDIIGQRSSKDDKSALQTFKNGCSVIKSMSIDKIRKSSKKRKKSKLEPCKTPKSDDSGGFRERFHLRRHLSTSTLDAHTKVRDWIANEVMHRCSPSILRKSNSDLNTHKNMSVAKPYTRSEELLSETKKDKKDLKIHDNASPKKLVSKNASSNRTKTSEKTTSTSAFGSHSSIGTNKQSLSSTKRTDKSNDSLKSKGTDSIKSKKVSIAIDATPAARTNSILNQEPIELSKPFNSNELIELNTDNQLRRSKTEGEILVKPKLDEDNKTFTNVVTFSLSQDKPLIISHKHSTSDPVTDVNYDKLKKELELNSQIADILPPVTFRNDINVTSRDDNSPTESLTAAEALLTIKRRNFPKVLPDLPKAQKRLSLQPATLQTFRNYMSNTGSQMDRPKVPPQPPPRTTTLERRLAYQNTKPLSSFDSFNVKKTPENNSANYVNLDDISESTCPSIIDSLHRSFESGSETPSTQPSKEREYPKVIIASADAPLTMDPKYFIRPSPSQVEIAPNAPRVRLPDDFHSETLGSVTSFSSFCSDDDIDDDDLIEEDEAEDQLIQELVGGVEFPTNMEDVLDTKGPATMFEKKLEIVPVKINTLNKTVLEKDYVCITDLHLPDVNDLENTARIKPNFGLNKLQHRSESIHKPPEKAVKVKQKKTIKPTALLNKGLKQKRGSSKSTDSSKLEHSNSGSSNDTETSTGTVRKVEMKKE